MTKFEEFRNLYTEFIYDSYTITETDESVDVSYKFSIPGLSDFNPGWSFPKPAGMSVAGDLTFEKIAFSLGLAELISYWKCACPPVIRVNCGELSESQILWWKKLWYLGLGEYFYRNQITTDIDSFCSIIPQGKFTNSNTPELAPLNGCLVTIGGGKDSALTIETLTQAGIDCRCYSINKRRSICATVETAGLPDSALITAQRRFDRTLVDINSRGFLNGHTPFSSIVAFSAEAVAYLNRLQYIVLSNEASANESTVKGQDVNHQYSKSFEFERDFHDYEKIMGTGIYYFSFLRPLTEFQIAKMFVSHKKYLSIFRSCNLGSKVSPDIWCGDCPKCLFVCLILSPFLSFGELQAIFGKDMLNDPAMEDYFTELIGLSEHKPFECVGSIDEVNLAVTLAVMKAEKNGEKLPLLFENYKKTGLYDPKSADKKNQDICAFYSNENILPDSFREILTKEMERLL